MMRRRQLLLGMAALAVPALSIRPAQAQQGFVPTAPVQGQLISRSQGPVPGVMVSLLHPVLGRSAPSYTDVYGRFGWSAIPVRSEPYYLEIYWGPNLIYRQPIQVRGPLALPPIYL